MEKISDTIKQCIPLKRQGRHFIAVCPFHYEETPSFTVDDAKNRFKCFGCGIEGNADKFVDEFAREKELETASWQRFLSSMNSGTYHISCELIKPSNKPTKKG